MSKSTTTEPLQNLLDALILEITRDPLDVTEGRVMTVGPPPYRRLDCDGRALAYVRRRSRKQAVRIDISGLWAAERPSRLRVPTASGAATLMVRCADDLDEALAYLRDTIERTRRNQARQLQQGGPAFRF